MKTSLKCIIESRLNSKATGSSCEVDDLLGLMLEASESDGKPKLNVNEIIEECKTFFFAGHETSSNLLTWTVFLLSLHPEWQEKLRQEVLKECGMGIPDADMLTKLKLVRYLKMYINYLFNCHVNIMLCLSFSKIVMSCVVSWPCPYPLSIVVNILR